MAEQEIKEVIVSITPVVDEKAAKDAENRLDHISRIRKVDSTQSRWKSQPRRIPKIAEKPKVETGIKQRDIPAPKLIKPKRVMPDRQAGIVQRSTFGKKQEGVKIAEQPEVNIPEPKTIKPTQKQKKPYQLHRANVKPKREKVVADIQRDDNVETVAQTIEQPKQKRSRAPRKKKVQVAETETSRSSIFERFSGFFGGRQEDSRTGRVFKRKVNTSGQKRTMKSVDKQIDKSLGDRMKFKLKGMFKTKPKAYDDAPFRKFMMYLGSAMLLQYGFMMAGNMIKGVLSSASETEISSLKGRNYRQDLRRQGRSTKTFDEATERYSRLSGMQQYEVRGNLGDFFSRLDLQNVNTGALPAESIVSVLRGFESMYGDDMVKAQDRLSKLLTKPLSKEERKEYGISSRNNPTAILQEILETLKKSASGRIGMNEMLLRDRLRAITTAPMGMLDMVQSNFPDIFNRIAEGISKFASGFFSKDPGMTQARWVTFFETVRRFVDVVITNENGMGLANTLLDAFGSSLGVVVAALEKIAELNKKTDGWLGKIAKWAFYIWGGAKVLHGLFSMVTGFLSTLGIVKVAGAGAAGAAAAGTTLTAFGSAIVGALAAAAPYIGAAIATAIIGYGIWKGAGKLGTWLGEKYNDARDWWAKYKENQDYTGIANRYGYFGKDAREWLLTHGHEDDVYTIDNMHAVNRGEMPYGDAFGGYGSQLQDILRLHGVSGELPTQPIYVDQIATPLDIKDIVAQTYTPTAMPKATEDIFSNNTNELGLRPTVINATNVYMNREGLQIDTLINGVGGAY